MDSDEVKAVLHRMFGGPFGPEDYDEIPNPMKEVADMIHELTVDGRVVSGVGDVAMYDADQPVAIRVDSMAILDGGLEWLKSTSTVIDPFEASVQSVIGTEAGGVVVAVFRGDDERLWAHVAIEAAGGPQVHLAELGGGRRFTPLVSVPGRGYCYDSGSWHDDPDGDATYVAQWTVVVVDGGAWHRTTWEHAVDACAYLCAPLGLSAGQSVI